MKGGWRKSPPAHGTGIKTLGESPKGPEGIHFVGKCNLALGRLSSMVIHDVYPTPQRLKYVEVGVAFTLRSVPASTDETVVNITSELIECINLSGNQMFPDLFFFQRLGPERFEVLRERKISALGVSAF